jgi:hypothetical protein
MKNKYKILRIKKCRNILDLDKIEQYNSLKNILEIVNFIYDNDQNNYMIKKDMRFLKLNYLKYD